MINLFGRGKVGELADRLKEKIKGHRLTYVEKHIIAQGQRRMIDRASDPSFDSGYWKARLLDILNNKV